MNIPESIEFKEVVKVLKELNYPACVKSEEEGYVIIPSFEEMLENFIGYYWNNFDKFDRDNSEFSNMSDEEYFNFVDEKAIQNVYIELEKITNDDDDKAFMFRLRGE